MAKGGGGTSTQYVKSEQSNLPEYARPYFEGMMQRSQSLLSQDYQPYQDANGNPIERIADFTQQQRGVQNNIMGMQTPGQFGQASDMVNQAGLGTLAAANYGPGRFRAQMIGQPNLSEYTMQGPADVQAQQYGSPQMNAAQTGFQPNLTAYQMGPTRDVRSQRVNAPMMQGAQTSFGSQPLEQYRMAAPDQFGNVQAQQYMSPYTQNVLDVQKREAIRDAKKGQLVEDLGAARQGTYGGSRQLLAGLERERNLGQQLGDIEARGMQSAYENAQQQFERDRSAGMQAGQQNLSAALQQQQLGTQTGLQAALANLSNDQQARVNNQAMQFQAQGMNAENAMKAALANQGVDVTRAQANQQAQLSTQQLGTQTGLQAALANLDANQQAQVQNLAAQLQTQGLNANQAMQAALANQQMGYNVNNANLQSLLQTQQLGAQTGLAALQSNQQYGLEAQRLGEQSRQFAAQNALAGYGQLGQFGQTLANIGQTQQNMDLSRLGMQQQTAAQEQALQQQRMDQQYQDFLRQRDYPLEMLQQYSSLLRGVPVAPSSTTTAYAPAPSLASQLLGTGLSAAGLYNMYKGG